MLQQVAPHVRLFANALTLLLALYGAMGWVMDPQLSLIERFVCAGIALIAQQLANAAAACAGVAATFGKRASVAGALALMVVFAGVSGHAIEHALERPAAAREASVRVARVEERARLLAEIRAATQDRLTAEAAARAIPSDIPTRRIQALQAPLDAAIARSDARVAALETERAALDAPIARETNAKDTVLSVLFWLLAYAEPLFYLLLATLRDGVPSVPNACPKRATTVAGTPRRRGPGASHVLGRLAVAVGLTAASAAQAAETPDSVSRPTAARTQNEEFVVGTTGRAAGTLAAKASPPHEELLVAALELRARGYSLRRIATTLGRSSKSSIHRMLQRADAARATPSPEPRPARP